MAKCPACGGKLRFWNIKAECPHCSVNIPNHDWEKRLEKDALEREESYFKLHTTLNKLKYVLIGTPLRLIRFIFSFLPIIGYILPLASLKLQSETAFVDIGSINLIALFTKEGFKIGDVIGMITSDISNPTNKLALCSFGALALSLVFAVLAFFCIPIICKKVKQGATLIFHLFSLVLYALSPVYFDKFVASAGCEGQWLWGIYVGIALFAVVLILDIIIQLIKVDEKTYKYVPTDDELQREYAIKIGAITEDEFPYKKSKQEEAE